MSTVTLVPVKDFEHAKTRLAPVLGDAERAGLAAAMAADVIAAVRPHGRCMLLGGADARNLAAALGVEWRDDRAAAGLIPALDAAAGDLAATDVARLLVVPSDLPMLCAADVGELLARYRGGVAVCPAERDGGTNALLVAPPNAIPFLFGTDSARRHLEAGLAAGLTTQRLPLPGFARDIDTPDDLRWLCGRAPGPRTAAFLAATGLRRRLGGAVAADGESR